MKTGIIGLPQVGKTSLFGILTKVHLSEQAYSNPREAHIGVAKVPDERLDKLAALYHPKKLTHASVENVELDLMVSDLGQIEKRLERLEKDLKKMKTPELERENELLIKAKAFLETEKPLREMEMSPEDKKRIRGFMFLSEKPMLYVLNIGESTELGKDLEAAVAKYKLTEVATRPNAGASAICGKVEAELSEMSDADAAEFLSSYGLTESGLARLIRKTYALLGLISFFTAGEDECRAWTIPVNTRAVQGAGAIHSDLEHHFIRAETIRWDQLLEAGSEANARARGTLRLEGKDYIVQDGDVMHIRHSG